MATWFTLTLQTFGAATSSKTGEKPSRVSHVAAAVLLRLLRVLITPQNQILTGPSPQSVLHLRACALQRVDTRLLNQQPWGSIGYPSRFSSCWQEQLMLVSTMSYYVVSGSQNVLLITIFFICRVPMNGEYNFSGFCYFRTLD